jgi:hypothetical protein
MSFNEILTYLSIFSVTASTLLVLVLVVTENTCRNYDTPTGMFHIKKPVQLLTFTI